MRIVTLLLLAAGIPALSQDAVLPLSLKKAVEIALSPDGNTRVQIALEGRNIAESRAAQAKSVLLPNIDGSTSYSDQTRNLQAFGLGFGTLAPNLPFQIPPFVGPFTVFDARVNATQNIFDFSSIRRYQAAKVAVEATKADIQGTQNQVADQVARLYLAGIRAEAALETAQANVQVSEALLRLAQNQKNAGTGTGIEVVRAQVQLANDRQRLEVARNEVDQARLNLLRALGLKLDGRLELTDKMPYTPEEPPAPEQGWKTALEKRPELKAQQDRELGARLSYSATKWERLPSVAAFGDYGSSGTAINDSLPTRTVGVSARIPIFDGGRRDARRAESLAQYRQEQVRNRDVRQQVDLEIRQAIDAMRSAQAQVTAAREGLQLAEQELAQARRRYEAGVTTSVEVTDAQARLERARENQITALFNYNLARIDLSTATGTIQEFVNR